MWHKQNQSQLRLISPILLQIQRDMRCCREPGLEEALMKIFCNLSGDFLDWTPHFGQYVVVGSRSVENCLRVILTFQAVTVFKLDSMASQFFMIAVLLKIALMVRNVSDPIKLVRQSSAHCE